MRSYGRVTLCALGAGIFTLAAAQGCGGSGDAPGSGGSAGTSAGGAGSTYAGSGGGLTTGTGNSSGSGSGNASASSGTGSTGSGPIVPVACQAHFYACGDGNDNDGDGLTDSQDPDCLGPCDNTEGNFYGGIPGQTGSACLVDCYFDQDSGSGNDECNWNHKCDPNEVAPKYYPESNNGSKCEHDDKANTPGTNQTCAQLFDAQSKTCLDFCGPLTPNGCDCFGCCELPAGSGKHVWLGSEDANGNGSCSIADLDNPDKCQPCLQVKGCLNTCERCEICIGKTTVPADCLPGGSTSSSGSGSGSSGSGGGGQCSPGVQACGLPGQEPCSFDEYCITGCCQKIPALTSEGQTQ
jgi:hypothetical protein